MRNFEPGTSNFRLRLSRVSRGQIVFTTQCDDSWEDWLTKHVLKGETFPASLIKDLATADLLHHSSHSWWIMAMVLDRAPSTASRPAILREAAPIARVSHVDPANSWTPGCGSMGGRI